MARLTVILKHGFENDRAVVKINGATLLDRSALSTRTTVDRATAFDHDLDPGSARVDIQLPDRRLAKSVQIDVRDHQTLVVSIAGGAIEADVIDGVVGDA